MQQPAERQPEERDRSEEQGLETARGALLGIVGGCAFWFLLLLAVLAGIYSIQLGTG